MNRIMMSYYRSAVNYVDVHSGDGAEASWRMQNHDNPHQVHREDAANIDQLWSAPDN
jgi:hypothetical protein